MTPQRITRQDVLRKARASFTRGRRPTMDELAAETGVSRAVLFNLFGTRGALEEALGLAPNATSRERVTAAAAELVAEIGLARLSIDDVAARANVSRATVYRLFSGKPALYLEVLRVYTPMEELTATIGAMAGRPPAEVMPALALTVARFGALRLAVLRSVLVEAGAASLDADEALDYGMNMLSGLLGYLESEMTAGRLRTTDPLLALQAFAGPIIFHLLTRSTLEQRLGPVLPLDTAVTELAQIWLRAMKPPARRPRPAAVPPDRPVRKRAQRQ